MIISAMFIVVCFQLMWAVASYVYYITDETNHGSTMLDVCASVVVGFFVALCTSVMLCFFLSALLVLFGV